MPDDFEVGRTNCDRVDPHQHFGETGFGDWLFDEGQLFWSAEDPGLHGLRDKVVVAGLNSHSLDLS